MTVETLIKSAMRKLGLIASGESPTVEELNDGLEALQVMLRAWAGRRILVYASTRESFNLVAATSSYTWGSGGNISTARPHAVLGACVRDSGGTDHPVTLMSEGEYRALTSKSTPGRPSRLFYSPSYPLAYVYVYPTPETVEAVYIDSMKEFTETSSFDATSSTLSFPPNYEEAMIYNLAIRLGPEFGQSVSPEVASIAATSYESIATLNAGNQVEPIHLSLPVGSAGRYNINAG